MVDRRPAGRKRLSREESKRRTRELLLDAAEAVFAEKGFWGASVEEVAEEAGFSTGAVYSNFGGKDDLFLALLDRRLARDAPEWGRVFGEQTPPGERVGEVEGILMSGSGDRAWTMLEMEFFLYAMRNEEARKKLVERYRGIREGIAAAVGGHFEQIGVSPPAPIEELSWALLGMATGLDLQAHLDPEATPDGLRAKALDPLLGRTDEN